MEVALLSPILLIVLAFPLLFGRFFYHYEVAQKAAHDAAVYFSSVALIEMNSAVQVQHAAEVASAIVAAEIADLNPGPSPPAFAVQCDGAPCDGLSVPATIAVKVHIAIFDTAFGAFTNEVVGDNGLLVKAEVTMRYVGK